MSLSQSMPPNYQSLLYPNAGTNQALPQQTILPAELAHGTGGNAADYMSKAVGGGKRRKHRANHRCTIVRYVCKKCKRSYKCQPKGAGRRKTRKIHRRRRG